MRANRSFAAQIVASAASGTAVAGSLVSESTSLLNTRLHRSGWFGTTGQSLTVQSTEDQDQAKLADSCKEVVEAELGDKEGDQAATASVVPRIPVPAELDGGAHVPLETATRSNSGGLSTRCEVASRKAKGSVVEVNELERASASTSTVDSAQGIPEKPSLEEFDLDELLFGDDWLDNDLV